MPIKCKTCTHYKNPFHHYCRGCKRNPNLLDYYDPLPQKSLRNGPHPRQLQDLDEPYYNKIKRIDDILS